MNVIGLEFGVFMPGPSQKNGKHHVIRKYFDTGICYGNGTLNYTQFHEIRIGIC